MFRVATREETSTLPTTGPLWWESYGDRHVMRSQPTRPANLSHVSSNHASQGLLCTNKAWNPAFRFNVSVTTWYKQGLEPGISFHCLCDNWVQTRLGARHFVWLSLWRLGTNKAWDPEFRVIVSVTTWYRQGLKPGISFHCLRDYLLQTRPGTRHFISLSPGRLGTIKVWNPTFHFIVSGTTWYKQCPKPDISFHCLWDELVQTMPETRHFISLSPGLLVTNNAWNPAFHFIVRGTTCYKQCLKPGISFHCLWDFLVQTRPETRHFISLSEGLLVTNNDWNPAFHFIVSGTTWYKTRPETRHFISLSRGLLGANKAWNPAFYFISRSIEDRVVIARFSVLHRWFWQHCRSTCCLPSYPGLSPGSAREDTSGSGWRPWRKGRCDKMRKPKVTKYSSIFVLWLNVLTCVDNGRW